LSDWGKFFLQRLPVALLLVAAIVEAAAYFLNGVTLHRHNVDDLASAVLHDRHPYKVVLLGDSVTHNVAHSYRIGEPDEVADLTTHAYAGLPSSLFLLKRYLESGHRPQHVIIAASRDIFVAPMDPDVFTYYVTSVFTQPYERNFLLAHYPRYVNYSWRPAVLSVTTRLGEPLFSLLRNPSNDIWSAPQVPVPNPILEAYRDDTVDQTVLGKKLEMPDVIRPEVQAILNEFCSLSQRYGFALHIIWAPSQQQVRLGLQANGKIIKIDEQLAALFKANQTAVSIDDSADRHSYPYFDRDLIHIKGLGWEQLYAGDLLAYVRGFEQRGPRQLSAVRKDPR
jgi:hypothetical protein